MIESEQYLLSLVEAEIFAVMESLYILEMLSAFVLILMLAMLLYSIRLDRESE